MAPTASADVAGPEPPASWYHEARASRAEDAVDEPAEQSLVAAAAERLERERAVARGVVADRGDAVLLDRELEPERALRRDDERLGRACREQRSAGAGPRLADRARPRSAERGHEQRDDADGDDERQSGEAAEPVCGTPLGSARTPRVPRGPGRHRADGNGRSWWLQGGRHGGTL